MINNEMKKYMAPPIHDSQGVPPVIVLSGSNYDMGYQYGSQLASKIYTLMIKEKASIYPQWH